MPPRRIKYRSVAREVPGDRKPCFVSDDLSSDSEGADLNQPASNGHDSGPAHMAALNGHGHVVEWLGWAGANLEATDSRGLRPSQVLEAKRQQQRQENGREEPSIEKTPTDYSPSVAHALALRGMLGILGALERHTPQFAIVVIGDAGAPRQGQNLQPTTPESYCVQPCLTIVMSGAPGLFPAGLVIPPVTCAAQPAGEITATLSAAARDPRTNFLLARLPSDHARCHSHHPEALVLSALRDLLTVRASVSQSSVASSSLQSFQSSFLSSATSDEDDEGPEISAAVSQEVEKKKIPVLLYTLRCPCMACGTLVSELISAIGTIFIYIFIYLYIYLYNVMG